MIGSLGYWSHAQDHANPRSRIKLQLLRIHSGRDRTRVRRTQGFDHSFCKSLQAGSSAFYPFEEFAGRHLKCRGERRQMAKANLARPSLQVRDVNLVDARVFGEVDLPPTPLLSELPDSFAKLDADIRQHSSSIDLAEALYLVDALSSEVRAWDCPVIPASRVEPDMRGRADNTPAMANASIQAENLRSFSTREETMVTNRGLLTENGQQ